MLGKNQRTTLHQLSLGEAECCASYGAYFRRPGAAKVSKGLLDRLVELGLAETERVNGYGADSRVYSITPAGREAIND